MLKGDHTVPSNIGYVKNAAKYIDAWLRQTKVESKEKKAPEFFQELNTWNYAHAPHAMREHLDGTRRIDNFSEVVHGLDKSTAFYEARRCMSRGNCVGVFPDHAIKEFGPGVGFAIDLDYCRGLRHLSE